MIIANLGDSRAVMGTISQDGQLQAIQVTTDLKPSVPSKPSFCTLSMGSMRTSQEFMSSNITIIGSNSDMQRRQIEYGRAMGGFSH